MEGVLPGEPSNHGMYDDVPNNKLDESDSWYLSRKEIEENSPSRRDGIDLKKETYLRKSYCTFLQDLGMRLKVPQVTIATAIIFCHRFFLRHSHASNDRRTIATVCMFLAGKVEETPRPLKDVILVSYEIINKKDPAAAQKIKQKEVYEQQKELILTSERLVLGTLAFDFNVFHPYKPLVEAIKKFKVAQNALAQVAWNFVNDGLRTSLCLQFKPHHIAAGAIFLAAKFLKVKLPSDGERVWWQEFDVTPRQLEEVSNQMLELYEQNRVPPQGSEMEGSTGVTATATPSHRPPLKSATSNDDHQTATTLSKSATLKPASSKHASDQPYADANGEEHRSSKIKNSSNNQNSLKSESGDLSEREAEISGRNSELRESTGQSPRETIKKIDKNKVKAALEKQKKLRGDAARKVDSMDDDDLIERELEDGIELALEGEKIEKERILKPENVEEGEVSAVDDDGDRGREPRSPRSNVRKRKAENSPDNTSRSHLKQQYDYIDDRNKIGRS